MGPDARDAPLDREQEDDSFDVTHPTAVMIEQDKNVRSGELLQLGRRCARIRTHQPFRRGERLVLTVSVPESRSEKTQAIFRLSSRVRRRSHGGGQNDYVVHFLTDYENLDNAGKLYARFQDRGIVEV